MPNATTAKTIFEETRRFYEAGGKSANKRYDTVNASWWKRISGKAVQRNVGQLAAAAALPIQRGQTQGMGILQTGAYVLNAGVPVANCGELACLAAYLATAAGVHSTELALASVVTPNPGPAGRSADHVFALYGTPQRLTLLENSNGLPAAALTNISRGAPIFHDQVYALDAWANVWCSLEQYAAKVASKMQSWQGQGKRVFWVYGGGPNDYEWTPPGGQYSQVFAAASLQIIRC
jgi:hypothetical protein